MLFSAQRFLEDLFRASGLRDPDQYAVTLANLYFSRRAGASKKKFLEVMRKAKTAFFRVNGIDRDGFEQKLLSALDQRFKKKLETNPAPALKERLGPAIRTEARIIRRAPRRTMGMLLQSFRRGVQSLGIDQFWKSRRAGQLKPYPEAIARDTLAVMLHGVLEGRSIALKEIASGIGRIDVSVARASGNRIVLDIVELKVLKSGALKGAAQLGRYLQNADRKEGWLVVIDARRPARKTPLPKRIQLNGSCVAHVVVVDINPPAPSDE